MGSVLSYSGLSTKIRAMQSRLVTDEQLEEIVQLPNVPQVTAYLKRTPEYQNIWSGLDENDLHRGQIEKLLKKSIFLNFSRLYHFANQEQRTFLSLYSTTGTPIPWIFLPTAIFSDIIPSWTLTGLPPAPIWMNSLRH